jgi:RNA polymerase sigma-70 factor (ECF subfamily)
MQYSHALSGAAAGRQLSIEQQMSDQALVRLIARCDKHAMQVLFARYSVRMFRFLIRLVDSEALAEDLMSEAFIEVWRHAGQYEARSLVSRFLLPGARRSAQRCARAGTAHREIIDLVYYHERSIDDVAKIIGVPRNTVKTRMFYARGRIAKLMTAKGIERAWL